MKRGAKVPPFPYYVVGDGAGNHYVETADAGAQRRIVFQTRSRFEAAAFIEGLRMAWGAAERMDSVIDGYRRGLLDEVVSRRKPRKSRNPKSRRRR